MARKRTLPAVPNTGDRSLNTFLERMRQEVNRVHTDDETRRTVERIVTERTVASDTQKPPTPTNISLTPEALGVFVSADALNFDGLYVFELLRSPTSSFTQASVVNIFRRQCFDFTGNADATYHYWVRAVSSGGVSNESARRSATTVALSDAQIGNRTVNATTDDISNTGNVTELFSWLAGQTQQITGEDDWKTDPKATLSEARGHFDSTSNPHETTLEQARQQDNFLEAEIQFASISAPGSDPGLLWLDEDTGYLTYYDQGGESTAIGNHVTLRAKNDSGDTLNRGDVVAVSGATGENPRIVNADADNLDIGSVVGLVWTSTINNNAVGKVIAFGRLNGVDTSQWSEGDFLYIASGGGLTDTKPEGPSLSIKIGVVIRSHASDGAILVDVDGIPRLFDVGSYGTGLSLDSQENDLSFDVDWGDERYTLKTDFDSHIDDFDNPHEVTLEQARAQNNTVYGSIDMGGHRITDLGFPDEGTDAATKDYADNLVSGVAWQDPVERFESDPPSSPEMGDRYIVENGTGDWDGHDDEIAEWDGADWQFYAPSHGWVVKVFEEGKFYRYRDDDTWGVFSDFIHHGNLSGLQGGTSDEYFHLTQTEHGRVTSFFDTGVTESLSDIESHIGDDDIHFTKSEIEITRSQVTDFFDADFWDEIPDKPSEFPPEAHTHDAGDIDSGTFSDARIAESSVTQHEEALSITEIQITDLGDYIEDVTSQDSITGDGVATALSLVNDEDSPGNDKYYGTDDTGTKGWFDLPEGGNGDINWGDIGGTLSDQTDLQNALDDKADDSAFQNHVNDSSIHFTQSEIEITESQISDLGDYLESGDVGDAAFRDVGTSSGEVADNQTLLSGIDVANTSEPAKAYFNKRFPKSASVATQFVFLIGKVHRGESDPEDSVGWAGDLHAPGHSNSNNNTGIFSARINYFRVANTSDVLVDLMHAPYGDGDSMKAQIVTCEWDGDEYYAIDFPGARAVRDAYLTGVATNPDRVVAQFVERSEVSNIQGYVPGSNASGEGVQYAGRPADRIADNNPDLETETAYHTGNLDPLEQDDLAAEGGTIPQVDRSEVVTSMWNWPNTGRHIIFGGGNSADFSFERVENEWEGLDWEYVRTLGSGHGSLGLIIGRTEAESNTDRKIALHPANGVVIGKPSGLFQGRGTVNGEELYEDGNRVQTDYVFDAYIDGQIDYDHYDALMGTRMVESDTETETVEEDEEVTEPVTSVREEWDEKQQAYIRRTVTEHRPVYDDYPVKDEKGNEVSRKRVKRTQKVTKYVPKQVEVQDEHKPARRYELDDLDPDAFWQKCQQFRKLPAFKRCEDNLREGQERPSMGQISQALTETVEDMAVHIHELHERVKSLEGKK